MARNPPSLIFRSAVLPYGVSDCGFLVLMARHKGAKRPAMQFFGAEDKRGGDFPDLIGPLDLIRSLCSYSNRPGRRPGALYSNDQGRSRTASTTSRW